MSNLKLGKKNNFEKGSFTAYACNCNCMTISCGTCNNCNYSTPESTGQFNLDYVNNMQLDNSSTNTIILFG